jgi:regulator of protease activity HflC (stomatin/prohibitin superfamily)
VLQNRDKINFKAQQVVDEITEPWDIAIEHVEMKDVEILPTIQRAMAKEAEALIIRENAPELSRLLQNRKLLRS